MKPILAALGAVVVAAAGYFIYDEFFKTYPFGSTDAVVSTLRGNLTETREPAASPAAAALAMIDAIDPAGATDLVQPLDSQDRASWSNLPAGIYGGRVGVRLGDLDAQGNDAVWAFLRTALSEEGFQEVTKVVLADKVLGETEGAPRFGWGSDNFWVAIYGAPSEEGAWAWQFGGHHLALNMAVNGDRMVFSPFFFGTEPADFEDNGAQVLPAGGVPVAAFAFMETLEPAQAASARVSERPEEVYAGAGNDDLVPAQEGLALSQLSAPQAGALEVLLGELVGLMPEPAASTRLQALRAEFDQSTFAWNGETDGSTRIYFQFQSPSALIEFSTQGVIGADAGHYHAIYRNLGDDYGAALLAQ
ncbi:MAG: DUF3500 domain-containing protein [Pseudomonadota bacterium]